MILLKTPKNYKNRGGQKMLRFECLNDFNGECSDMELMLFSNCVIYDALKQNFEDDTEAFEQMYDELTTRTQHSGNQLQLR